MGAGAVLGRLWINGDGIPEATGVVELAVAAETDGSVDWEVVWGTSGGEVDESAAVRASRLTDESRSRRMSDV
jgi:hypothetical protein